MSENRLWRLADELAAELKEFLKLKDEIAEAQSRFSAREPSAFERRGLGSILHDVYQSAEGVFQRIAKEIDRGVPIGENWHRLLLDKMANPITKTRPAVIQPETAAMLDEYRRFRHRFRNLYGFKLDWTQMKPLLGNATSTIDTFTADIKQFIAFLRMMSDNNEPHSGK